MSWTDDTGYDIVSIGGYYWDRVQLCNLAKHMIRRMWFGTVYLEPMLAQVDPILDDHEWCRGYRGYIPSAFARAVEEEALRRALRKGTP
jgi:hypothetical protein